MMAPIPYQVSRTQEVLILLFAARQKFRRCNFEWLSQNCCKSIQDSDPYRNKSLLSRFRLFYNRRHMLLLFL